MEVLVDAIPLDNGEPKYHQRLHYGLYVNSRAIIRPFHILSYKQYLENEILQFSKKNSSVPNQ
jgi:hypothetical protein